MPLPPRPPTMVNKHCQTLSRTTVGWKIPTSFQNRTKLLPHMARAADSPPPFSEAEVPACFLQEAGLPQRLCVTPSAQARDWGIPSVLARTPTHDK